MNEDTNTLYCYNHPNTETNLRCNNCERPICPKCAVLTPTGYRCKECIRSHKKIFNTAEWYDYPVAFLVAALISYLGSLIAVRIGFFIIFIAPIAGMITAEAVRFVVRKRRSQQLTITAGVAAALGSTFSILVMLVFLGGYSLLSFRLLWQGLYAFMVTSTVLYRLGGIRIK